MCDLTKSTTAVRVCALLLWIQAIRSIKIASENSEDPVHFTVDAAGFFFANTEG
jgi:hypothetical protein